MSSNAKREPGMYWYGKFTPWERLVQKCYVTVIYNNLISAESAEITGEVVLPEGIVTIAKNAFKNCRLLSKIVLPGSVQIIDEFAFFKCIRLEEVKFNKGLQEVRRAAFAYCSKLKYIRLPDSVSIIGKDAFYDCCNVNTVKMPKNLSDIGENALWNCNPNHVVWRGDDYNYIQAFLTAFNCEGGNSCTSYFE